MMKAIFYLILAMISLYTFTDLFLYYLDCDILNITPNDNVFEIVTFVLSSFILYKALESNYRKAGKKW